MAFCSHPCIQCAGARLLQGLNHRDIPHHNAYLAGTHDVPARCLQNGGEDSSPPDNHTSQPCCEPARETHTWEQLSQVQEEAMERPEMAQRKVRGKCKVKSQKDKDAEKVAYPTSISNVLSLQPCMKFTHLPQGLDSPLMFCCDTHMPSCTCLAAFQTLQYYL